VLWCVVCGGGDGSNSSIPVPLLSDTAPSPMKEDLDSGFKAYTVGLHIEKEMATLITTKILNDTAVEVEINLDDWIFTRDALLFAFSSIVKDEDRIMVIGLWEQGDEDNEYVLQPIGHGTITHRKKPHWIQHKDVYLDMDMVKLKAVCQSVTAPNRKKDMHTLCWIQCGFF
jgi:hypothetical protein